MRPIASIGLIYLFLNPFLQKSALAEYPQTGFAQLKIKE